MTSIALVFSMIPITPGARPIKAGMSRLSATIIAVAIEAVIATSAMSSIEFPVITVAPTMLVAVIVVCNGNCR
jgi:uncharacterized membrane protein YccC